MRRFKTLCVSLAIVCTASTSAMAWGNRDRGRRNFRPLKRLQQFKQVKQAKSVPELDPNAAGGALILLIGGTLVLLERRRG